MDLFEGIEQVGVVRLRDALSQQPFDRDAVTDALKVIVTGKTRDGNQAELLARQLGILRDDELHGMIEAVAEGYPQL